MSHSGSLPASTTRAASEMCMLSPSPKTRGTASLTSRMMTSAVLAMSRHTPVEPPKLKYPWLSIGETQNIATLTVS